MKYEVRVRFDVYPPGWGILHKGNLAISVEAHDSDGAVAKLAAALQRAFGDESITVRVTGP